MANDREAAVQNGKVHVNWFNFNVPTILAVAGVGWAVASYVASMEARIEKIEEYRVSRSAITDRNFDDIERQLEPLENMPYRMNIVEQQIISTNQRLDRFTELISNTLDAIREDVAALDKKVEVLSSKFDSILPPRQRASADKPPV